MKIYARIIFNTEIALAFKPITIHCFHGKFHGQKQEKKPASNSFDRIAMENVCKHLFATKIDFKSALYKSTH